MQEDRDSLIKDDEVSGWQAPGQVQRNYHRKRRSDRRRRRKTFRLDKRHVMMLACGAVLIFSLTQLGAWGLRALNTYRTNAELQAMREAAIRNAAIVTQAPIMTPYPGATATPRATAVEAGPQRTPVSLVTATPLPQSKIFQNTVGDILPELQALYEKNKDLIGWLTIPGVVDLPVVYKDNSYYLYRDFNKKDSKSGTLFLDENHPLEKTTQHLVIHGHNMSDGSMFGLLAHYRDKKYLQEHGIITLSTLYQKDTYAVFAVALTPEDTSDPDFIPFIGMRTFANEEGFQWFLDKVKQGSIYQAFMDVQYTDALLTLSTCLDDDRLLLVCRRLREGETVESLKRLQQLSTK